MTTIAPPSEVVATRPVTAEAPATAGEVSWGNSAPLALATFAITTFMFSMINAGLFNTGTLPAVFGVGFIVGGLTQLIAGVIQLRTGNTFDGVLFSTFGAFWLALYFDLQFYLKEVPATQAGHALALVLFAFGIFAALMLAASFRTSIVVCVALLDLTATLFVLGVGKYAANAGLVKAAGWMGLLLAAIAFYLALAAVCEASYGREVLPVGHLAKK
jgi:succinate-acetate transporter protein